jgi:hypothetical protein
MSKKSKVERTVSKNPLRPQGFNDESIRNFQLTTTKGKATDVEFVDGKLCLIYGS